MVLNLAALGTAILVIALSMAFIVNWFSSSKKGGHSNDKAANGKHVAQIPSTDSNKEHATIIFGTQTGTAERFAKTLKSQLESIYGEYTIFDVIDAENYSPEERLPNEKLVILMMATYGDGEPTDNAAEFYRWITEEAHHLGHSLLSNLNYAVFALGNRQYEHFAAVGKKLHKVLAEAGGNAIINVGTGDDDADIDADFDVWCTNLFDALATSTLLKAGKAQTLTPDAVAAYTVEELKKAPKDGVDVLANGAGMAPIAPHLATITTIRELHGPASDRSCVHVEVDISGCRASYEAGDHVGVYVQNSTAVVEAAAAALGWSLDKIFKLKLPANNSHNLPNPPTTNAVTVRFALSRYADLLNSPSKAALAALAAFASDKVEAEKLSHMASIEGRDAYNSYIVAPKRALLEVLQDFPSAKPPIGAFFGGVAARLQPRFYSISSSPALHPRTVHITCAVVKDKMPSGRIHEGVASNWLQKAKPGDKLQVFIRHSTFKLPRDFSTPVVMVGPGTGLAPMRGFIQEREVAKKKGTALGDGALYFGCRRRDQDYIYAEELENAVATGVLSSLNLAFSREGKVKDYVQHHMKRNAAELLSVLKDNKGYLYVCGDAKHMASDVHATLSAVMGEAEMKKLHDSGRYLKDVW